MSEFKVGDKVVGTYEYGAKDVYEVVGGCIGGVSYSPDRSGNIYTAYITMKNGLPHHRSNLRHATPEEIAAGRRIDNDMGDDSHIENHISPNCKVTDAHINEADKLNRLG